MPIRKSNYHGKRNAPVTRASVQLSDHTGRHLIMNPPQDDYETSAAQTTPLHHDRSLPSFWFAIIGLLAVFTVLGASVFVFQFPTVVAILLAFLTAIVIGLIARYSYEEIQTFAFDSVRQAMAPILILMGVGALIGTWITSGTVPTIVSLGLTYLSPEHFLVGSLLLCIVTSMVTGASYGTVGTVGIALVAVAHGMQIDLAPVAGAIVSGAWFGDKMSPLSDSTNLSSAMAQVDLMTHIRHLLWTTVPAIAISIGVFAFMDSQRAIDSAVTESSDQLAADLQAQFDTSIINLIPAVIVIVLLALRKPAFTSIIIGALSAIPFAVLNQQVNWTDAAASLGGGYTTESGNELLDKLLMQGGVDGMMPTIGIMILALAMVGVLSGTGIMGAILQRLIHIITNRRRLMMSSVGITLLTASMSNSSSTHVLCGNLLRPLYDRFGIHRKNLSRILEDCATCPTPLGPWIDSGVFISAALGVAVTSYAPFAIFCFLSPLISLFWAITGWTVKSATIEEQGFGRAARRRKQSEEVASEPE